MAKTKTQTASTYKEKPKTSRPGIHAKTQTSHLKSSKNYRKIYKGQGK